MDILEFIQKFFLILLPGVISSYVYTSLNVQKQQHYYFDFLKIIMLAFTSYLLTDATFYTIKKLFPCFICSPIDIIHLIGSSKTTLPTANVFVASLFAIVLACLLTKASHENWLFKLAHKLNLTRRIDNQSVWEHVFDDCDVVVLRDCITKNIYYGKVYSFSDNSDNREIYFENVRVFTENAEFLYSAEKLYLSRAHNEFTIEVQNDTPENTTEEHT